MTSRDDKTRREVLATGTAALAVTAATPAMANRAPGIFRLAYLPVDLQFRVAPGTPAETLDVPPTRPGSD